MSEKPKTPRQLEVEKLVAAVTARYIATGKDLTVAEIATALDWPESRVRRVISSQGGCPFGLQYHQDVRPSYSRNYRSMQAGVHKIGVYGPTREALREQIKVQLNLRAAEMPFGCTLCNFVGTKAALDEHMKLHTFSLHVGGAQCPYPRCSFTGTDEEVDEHRASGVHNDEPQAGANLRGRS